MRSRLLSLSMFLLAVCGSELFAADDAAKFVEDVLPLLEAKCVSCHGPEKREGNLRLDSFSAAKAGGDRGAAIVPGDAEKSLLVQAISFRDPDLQMPPKQKLSAKEIATLTEWVKAGAVWPEPVAVLFEDQPQFLATLTGGNGNARLVTEGSFAGDASLGMTPLQRESAKIPNWDFAIREQPHPGEYRYLRLAWKKQYGGPSTFDLVDYKPELLKLNGKPGPASFKQNPDKVGGVFNHCKDELMAGPWKWAQHGASGQWVSELRPHTAKHIDELCQVRSMFSKSSNHAPATYLTNTGAILGGKPSLGSWVTYGLGSANQNLPGYVLLYKVGGLGGSANWSNAFLPAAFQGTQFRHEGSPVLNLQPPSELAAVQRSTLDFAQTLNRQHAAERPGVLDLDGRIASYELAYRMQSAALDIGELSLETKETQDSYGLHDENKDKALFGRMCLLASDEKSVMSGEGIGGGLI